MDTSEHILVIMLSVALAVLLVLAIAVAVLAIKLLKTINRISAKAENVIETAEHVSAAFSNAASRSLGGMAIFKVIKNVVDLVTKDKSKSDKKRG
jgi:hypothetical protein